ncbi:MAG: hydratase [Xanthobacteraceae bacterium]
MFSPYYKLARRRGTGDPLNHCALNVALYGAGGKRWAMTERGRTAVGRTATTLSIGPSALDWDGSALTIRFDEVTVPIPRRIRGTVRVTPAALSGAEFLLDDQGRHTWRPIAPCARIDVALERPALRWSGDGYLDCNCGTEPLEEAFVCWDWSRAALTDGTAVAYHATRRRGGDLNLALRFDRHGGFSDVQPSPRVALPPTMWRVTRSVGSENGAAEIPSTLEDAPFYARSLLAHRVCGEDAVAVHESLSLDRFRAPWVQAMLPFRMPRRTW